MSSFRTPSNIERSPFVRAIAASTEAWRIPTLHIVTGAGHALLLLAAGLAPLAVIALIMTFDQPRLVAAERRACLVGAALTSLMLLPLLRLAF